jgi:predicted DNA-binding transcriptional regulator AlpA
MSPKLRADLLQWAGDLEALMNARQVCQFFGNISKMTVYRWAQNPASGFPPPFKIGQKNYWTRREIIAFRDMRRARAQGGSPRVGAPIPGGWSKTICRDRRTQPRAAPLMLAAGA